MARAAETGEPYRTPLDPPLVDLGTGSSGTVAPFRPQDKYATAMKPSEPEPEDPPLVDRVAEERLSYAPQPLDRRTRPSTRGGGERSRQACPERGDPLNDRRTGISRSW